MLKEERHHIILTEIKAHQRVYSTELSKLLRVSEDTVRRDLHELAKSGHVRKVHGGAMANESSNPLPLDLPSNGSPELARIAAKAGDLITSDSVVILDGAQINLAIIDYLARDLSSTIFTNSLQVASRLFEFPHMETILLGGRLSSKHRVTTGMDVIHSLSDIHADICLMEIPSIHEDVGLSEADKEIANIKKAMIQSSSRIAALCLASGIGTMEPFKVCPLNTVDIVITDADPSQSGLRAISKKGVEVI